MKTLIAILFIFFVSIAIQSPQAAEIYRATDDEVIDFLEKGLEDNWFGSYYDDGESNNHKNGYMSEEFKGEYFCLLLINSFPNTESI